MLKKVLVIVLLIGLSVSAFAAKTGGTPIIGGGTGILTIPTASTIGSGVDLGFYFIAPDTIAVSAGFGLIPKLDLSVGFELDDDGSDTDPYLHLRGKYRFSGDNSTDKWAFGLDVTLAMGDGAADTSQITIYIVNTYFLSSWQFSWGFGYTFDNDDNINFMVGLSKEIISNLYLEMDFSNYPNRYYGGSHMNSGRGIVNIGARLHLFDGVLRLTAGLFDAFDDTREFGLGVALKLKL